MPSLRRFWRILHANRQSVGCVLGLAVFPLQAAPIILPAYDSPPLASPSPAVMEFARQRRLPLVGVDWAAGRPSAQPGDEVITLFTLFKEGAMLQWLGQFRLVTPNADELVVPQSEIVLHSSTGAKHVFTSAGSAIELRLFGPFSGADTGPVNEKHARMLVRSDYLGLGLEAWYADVLHRSEAPQPRFLPNHYSTRPFSAEQIARTSAIAQEVGFTAAADRGAAGGGLALAEFFSIAQHTPGLREIAEEVVTKPSLWSFLNLSRMGVGFYWADRNNVVTRFDPQIWDWPTVPVYRGRNVLVMNGRVAADVALFVTASRPPLSVCGGIVAFTVESSGRPGRRLEVRVVSARAAPP